MTGRATGLERFIVDVPDFPETGIVYKDITPLLADATARRAAIEALADPYRDEAVDAVFGIESRGFIFGVGVADSLGCSFVPVRKSGKLPRATFSASYDLEYGHDTLQVHADAVAAGARVLIVDDVLATGGTAAAAVELARSTAAEVVAVSVLIELTSLNGRTNVSVPVAAVMSA